MSLFSRTNIWQLVSNKKNSEYMIDFERAQLSKTENIISAA